jgi:hypothetical protein
VAPSVERDFVHCMAALLQTLVVLGVTGAGLAQFWRPARRARPAGVLAESPA